MIINHSGSFFIRHAKVLTGLFDPQLYWSSGFSMRCEGSLTLTVERLAAGTWLVWRVVVLVAGELVASGALIVVGVEDLEVGRGLEAGRGSRVVVGGGGGLGLPATADVTISACSKTISDERLTLARDNVILTLVLDVSSGDEAD